MRAYLTAYDAMYLALAEALDATVVTCDRRLGRAHGHDVRVEVVAVPG
jgi:predicted nucleic acid-binding protein